MRETRSWVMEVVADRGVALAFPPSAALSMYVCLLELHMMSVHSQ